MPIGGRWFSLEVVELLGAFLRGRDPKGFLLVVVEVGGVPGTLALRDKGSFNLLLVDGNPLSLREPLVVLDVRHAVLEVAVPFRQINL